MMRAWGCFALAAASGLLACSLLKKPGGGVDGGEDAAGVASAVTPEAGPGEAINASEMTRYPDEKPVDHAPLTAEQGGSLRTQAGSGGDLVIVLKRGTEVEKLAEHAGFYLVLADDPKDPTRKLMGWAAESVFGSAPLRRNEPEPRGDGGAPPPPPPHVVVADAGTKPPSPPPGPVKPLDVHKTNGVCPAGYASCAAVCRLTCKVESDCGISTAHCTGGFCVGPGAVPCK
jgi:hypothetical protein